MKDIQEKCYADYYSNLNEILLKIHPRLAVQVKEKIEKQKNDFYVRYPFLFSTHYSSIPESQIHLLTLSGNLYFSYLISLDSFIDGDTDAKPDLLIFLHLIHEKAMRLLCHLFPDESRFWIYFEEYEKEFFSSTIFENKIQRDTTLRDGIEQNELLAIAKGKCAYAKAATSALLILSGSSETHDPFSKTQDQFHIGLQLLDDLKDWRKDYIKGHPSYLLTTILKDKELVKRLSAKNKDPLDVLGRYIHYSGAADELLCLAISCFEKAIQSYTGYSVPLWDSVVRDHLKQCTELQRDRRDIKIWVRQQKEKVKTIHSNASLEIDDITHRIRLTSFSCNNVFASGLLYLLTEQKYNYPEMEHLMSLPVFEKTLEDSNSVKVSGNLFQRTIVFETLLDVCELMPNVISNDVLKQELDFIKSARLDWVRGGWNYFPTYRWLPPDTDDLAQVIRILHRSKSIEMKPIIDDAVDLVLHHNQNMNGTFKTWILDPSDNSPAQNILKHTVATTWGDYRGKDIEVTANMLYALWLYDTKKYSAVLAKGIESIINVQESQGYWQSVWYWDLYYGTYIAVRLLVKTKNNFEELERTYGFLKTTQHACGGWGHNKSDPLNTSFALLTLLDLKDYGLNFGHAIIERAMNYLLQEKSIDGAWRKVPFIKMFIGNKHVTYQSQTMTTAFAMRALVHCSKNRIGENTCK